MRVTRRPALIERGAGARSKVGVVVDDAPDRPFQKSLAIRRRSAPVSPAAPPRPPADPPEPVCPPTPPVPPAPLVVAELLPVTEPLPVAVPARWAGADNWRRRAAGAFRYSTGDEIRPCDERLRVSGHFADALVLACDIAGGAIELARTPGDASGRAITSRRLAGTVGRSASQAGADVDPRFTLRGRASAASTAHQAQPHCRRDRRRKRSSHNRMRLGEGELTLQELFWQLRAEKTRMPPRLELALSCNGLTPSPIRLRPALALLPQSWHRQITISRFWRRPHVKYGEAVAIRPGQQIEPPRLASLASLLRNIACSVSLSGRMAAPMIDLVARSLRQ